MLAHMRQSGSRVSTAAGRAPIGTGIGKRVGCACEAWAARLAEAALKHLLEKGKGTGSVTFGDVHDALLDNETNPTHLDSIIAALEEAGIAVIDDEEDA